MKVSLAVSDLVVACRYLTVLPLPPAAEAGDLGQAAGWFPLVGLLLGGLLAAAAVAGDFLAPPAVAAVLVVALWAGLTGALHLDGFADTLDGLGGGGTREEALEIMRDARIGTYGASGLVLLLGLKLAALESLPGDLAWRALLLAPVLGRLAPLILARRCPPARLEGAGQAFAAGVSAPSLAGAALVATVVALGCLRAWGGLLLVAAGVGATGFAAYLKQRLGGLTGDCVGALIEVTEAGTLAIVSALATLGAF